MTKTRDELQLEFNKCTVEILTAHKAILRSQSRVLAALVGAVVLLCVVVGLVLATGCAHVETRSDRPGAFDQRPVKGVVAK